MTRTTGSQPPTSHPTTTSATSTTSVRIQRWRDDGRRSVPRRPDGLILSLRQPHHRDRRHQAVTLELAGDLDLAGAPRFLAAMTWLRQRYHRIIVVDTRRLEFVDLAGYRAFTSSLAHPDGSRDPRILYVVGEVLARLRRHLALAGGVGPPRLS